MSILFQLSDGSVTFPANQLAHHHFFQQREHYLETSSYQFDLTTSEFLIILSYLIHKTLPNPGIYSDNLHKTADFLLLDELCDFLVTDVDYFLRKVDARDLEQLNSSKLTPYQLVHQLQPKNGSRESSYSTHVNHNFFYTSKPPIENISLIMGMDIDWDVFIYHTEYPVRYFNGGIFYPVHNVDEKQYEKAIFRLLTGITSYETEDEFLFFKKGSRTFRIALTRYDSIQSFLDTRNDSDAYFYGKNQGELQLWYSDRKIRFTHTQYNLFDPRYKRPVNRFVPIEFAGSYERNRHILSDYL